MGRKPETLRSKIINREIPLTRHIPYTYQYNADTVATRDGYLLQTIQYDGLCAQQQDKETVGHHKDLLALQLSSLADPRLAIYQHTFRRRVTRYPQGEQPQGFATLLDQAWQARLAEERLYINELYHTLVAKPFVGAQAGLIKLFSSLSLRTDKAERTALMAETTKLLNDKTHKLMVALEQYGPHKLRVKQQDNDFYSPILTFLGYLINARAQPTRLPKMDLAKYLPDTRIYFGHNTFILESATQRRYGAMIGIKEYCGQTDAGQLDDLFSLPHEFIATQSFSFVERHKALTLMKDAIKAFVNSEDYAESQAMELTQAQDDIQSGKTSLGYHHLSICVLGETEAELNQAVMALDSALTNKGLKVHREDLNMENAYWGQLPGNQKYLARIAPITTHNYAGFGSLHNQPVGQYENNHWGSALALLPTQAKTAFYFNFHINDVGHTTVIGPTGAGKTTVVGFFLTLASKFTPRLIILDKDRSNEVLVYALGGNYVRIQPGIKTGCAPLQLPDTPLNRLFLRTWLAMLLTAMDKDFSAADRELVDAAVRGNYELDQAHRTLANIAPFLGKAGSGSLQKRLDPWYGAGPYAYLFDNAVDTLDFKSQVTGIDLTHLLNDEIARRPLITYLTNRIEAILDGNPTIVDFEEGWKHLRDTDMEANLEDFLKTWRKKNATVLFCTNDPVETAKSRVVSTLVQQTSTNIFFPNYKADVESYRKFGCTDEEIRQLKNMNPATHCFLVKQGRASAVVQIDLSHNPELIRVLSSTERGVRELEALRARVGNDPRHWLNPFIKGVTQHENDTQQVLATA